MARGGAADWADEALSSQLADLRARGEGQQLEYIQAFPKNVRELAKEVAAFATSNAGLILLGVSDVGDLVGLDDMSTPQERDSLLKRLGGLCRGTVRPAITPVAKFAVEDGRVVLAISVPKGGQPVYYCHGVPYVRHLTESRPAEPAEVLELIRRWLASVSEEPTGPSETRQFISQLASLLVDVLVYGEQAEERQINPWLDLWRAQFGADAKELRELASHDAADKLGVSRNLTDLANALEDVATMHLHLGCRDKLAELTNNALDQARILKADLIDTRPITEESKDAARKAILQALRRLADLVERMDALADAGRVEEVQAEAASIGRNLVRFGYYGIDAIHEGLADAIRAIGRELHLVETMPLYLDGGHSTRLILERIQAQHDRLAEIATELASSE